LSDEVRPWHFLPAGGAGHRSMVTPLSLTIVTNEWRSSRGVQLVPSPAALVMRRNERRTLAASSGVPTLVQKT
jgi:hypothetical protein